MADPVIIVVQPQPVIQISVPAPAVIGTIVDRGPPGPAGASVEPGPGFKLVGDEIRYDFQSLTRA